MMLIEYVMAMRSGEISFTQCDEQHTTAEDDWVVVRRRR
jgi:hypothetical protein